MEYIYYRILFMPDCLSSVYGHLVHFANTFKTLLPELSSEFNQTLYKYDNTRGIQSTVVPLFYDNPWNQENMVLYCR